MLRILLFIQNLYKKGVTRNFWHQKRIKKKQKAGILEFFPA